MTVRSLRECLLLGVGVPLAFLAGYAAGTGVFRFHIYFLRLWLQCAP